LPVYVTQLILRTIMYDVVPLTLPSRYTHIHNVWKPTTVTMSWNSTRVRRKYCSTTRN